MLQGKKILLGVCGSIAAYKAALLVRLLIKAEAEVKVIMTASASDFITPLTLATLSRNPALSTFTKAEDGTWNNHVSLGLWADVMLIAPASANTIAKLANGNCDNLLSATYLSARCPVFIAPAMDLDMYKHPATLKNLETLKSYGNYIIEATEGELASGLHGVGRMAEPEFLVDVLQNYFSSAKEEMLKKKKILITAGPTYEAIDPVRFIGNHSSGKMGFALAEESARQGALVTVISGPTYEQISHPNIKVVKVTSAHEMYEATINNLPEKDIIIFAAAVADYTPSQHSAQKIKSNTDSLNILLSKTKDIAQEVGKLKKRGQFMVGFALETENENLNASQKLKKKNFDMIVLNSLNDSGAGFSHDTNKVSIFDKNNKKEVFELKSKKEVAKDIIKAIVNRYYV